ncbi:hypothetical protein BS17DRAFT_782876 [Gyrodon lividus]|nr:hypothetical protein BS17DRAFT_782876 [Gyrodon lividus]
MSRATALRAKSTCQPPLPIIRGFRDKKFTWRFLGIEIAESPAPLEATTINPDNTYKMLFAVGLGNPMTGNPATCPSQI